MLNCLIVDDEPLARQQIEAYVSRVPFLRLAGTARSAETARLILESEPVDLLFLDIQLPGLSGIDFLKTQPAFPQVVFITAFPDHAVTGFELEATDYLMKPVTFERFLKACEKAKLKSGNQPDYFYVKTGQRLERIRIADILYVEAMLNYVHIVTAAGRITAYAGMKAMEKELPKGLFVRVHKSYLAAVRHIDRVDGNRLLIGPHVLPLSRSRKKLILQSLTALK